MSAAFEGHSMAGRNRKNTLNRQPDGRVRPDPVRPHRQWVFNYGRIMKLHELNTEIGKLHLAGKINDQERDAGFAYREAREAYRLAMGFAPPYAKGQDMSAVRGLAIQPDDDAQRERREKAEKRLSTMEFAIGYHSRELRAVQWVCGEDRHHESYDQFIELKDGLRRLVLLRRTGR